MIPTYRFDGGVKIVNLGDVHRGSKHCDVKLYRKVIKTIKDNDDMYWVSTGDLMENATRNSVSSPYDAVSPEEEIELLEEELKPIRKKCLGFVGSNHPRRTKKESGLDADKTLAARAKIPFLGVQSVIKVTCGRCSYFIYLHHGVGGGMTGNKIARAERLAVNLLGCDVYMTGHTHTFAHWSDIHSMVDRKRDKITDIVTTHTVTGHYIKYTDSYAEEIGLKKKPRGSVVISLAGNESGKQENKKIKVDFLN